MLDQAALAEIETLHRDGARLTPLQIIEQSRSPNSALHRYFTWDDTEAAHAFRVIQAKQVLRVVVRIASKTVSPSLKVLASFAPTAVAPQAIIVQKSSNTFAESVRHLMNAIHEQRWDYDRSPEMEAVFVEINALLQAKIGLLTKQPGFRSPVMKISVEPFTPPPRRETNAIPVYCPGNRPCLGCQRPFNSKHVGHRLCDACHARS